MNKGGIVIILVFILIINAAIRFIMGDDWPLMVTSLWLQIFLTLGVLVLVFLILFNGEIYSDE